MLQITPKVYLIGSTKFDKESLSQYLSETGNKEFLDILTGADEMDICSFYAKLCYKSLSLGHNRNVSKIRDIEQNFINIIETGHGSICEHATLNFVAENVSRVLHTELVRHRVGVAFSAESGRYCYSGELKTWTPTIYDKYPEIKEEYLKTVQFCESQMNKVYDKYIKDCKDFHEKKELTSAIRRMKPLGCGETVGFTMNLRTLRHVIHMRTSRFAEEEIRLLFSQVADIVKEKVPLLFNDAKIESVNGINEYVFNKKI